MAVSSKGKLYITSDKPGDNHVFETTDFNETSKAERDECNALLAAKER